TSRASQISSRWYTAAFRMSNKAATRVLEEWIERDLSAAALKGELSPAFEIDDEITRAADVVSSGRNLIIAGEPGVGKKALVHELVRRSAGGSGPFTPASQRVLQFSFRHRTSALKNPRLLPPEVQRLVEALCETDGEIVPFFRDFHLAYSLDLEPHLQ